MMGIHLIEQESTSRLALSDDRSYEPAREQEERAREQLLATTRSNWLRSSRDGQSGRGE